MYLYLSLRSDFDAGVTKYLYFLLLCLRINRLHYADKSDFKIRTIFFLLFDMGKELLTKYSKCPIVLMLL